MKVLGAEIVDPADIPTDGKLDKTEIEVLLYEFKADLNAYLGGLPAGAKVHCMQEVIEFNELNKERAMPYLGRIACCKHRTKVR